MAHTALLVDDHQFARRYGKTCLEAMDYTVFTAGGRSEALDLLGRISPSLIVLDIAMPGGTGFELCREIRSQNLAPNAAILFVTANHSQGDVIEARRVGGDYLMVKPYEPDELAGAVKKAIRMHRLATRKGKA